MKVTKAEICNGKPKELKDYDLAIEIYVNKEREDKIAIISNPEMDMYQLMYCAYQLNQVLAKASGLELDEYLKLIKNVNNFSNRFGDMPLTEEQLQKLVEKDIRGY